MILRWLLSRTLRDACNLRRHVYRQLCAQHDLLTPAAMQIVSTALLDVRAAIDERAKIPALREKMRKLEEAATKWLKPYPHAAWRENVEVLLVAIAVAMGIRTYVLQPFKIPTGSMQPTLYGVTSTPDYGRVLVQIRGMMDDRERIQAALNAQQKSQEDIVIPSGLARVKDWLHGISYEHFVAPTDGVYEDMTKPFPPAVFSIYQKIKFAGEWHTLWFPPDCGEEPMNYRAGLEPGRTFRKGDDVIKLRVSAGDHLFVDRLTYNFRAPRRGEIVVFDTSGIDRLPPDQQGTFYIKRLVGLSGENLKLQKDYEVTGAPQPGGGTGTNLVGHLVVNGKDLSSDTPHFENLYSFGNPPSGTKSLAYVENHYYGHALLGELQRDSSFDVRPKHDFVMGDNTMNSSDSRFWGDFPSDHVIGKAFFVYWPLTKRFGIGQSATAQ